MQVVTLEKRLIEMQGTVDSSAESFVITGMMTQYSDALHDLQTKVQDWEASHGFPFTQKGKSLVQSITACLQATPLNPAKGLAELLVLPPLSTTAGESATTHRMVRCCSSMP